MAPPATLFVSWGILIHGLSLGKITGLYRYAVKGFSGDALDQVQLGPGETFPDDRRFALLKTSTVLDEFDPSNPTWLHKEKFLGAFTDPHLLAKYRASYSTQQAPLVNDQEESTTPHNQEQPGMHLTLYERTTNDLVLGPLDFSTEQGRQSLANFISKQSGIPVACVTATNTNNDTNNHDHRHRHQFGNTSSGWKQRKDTRTIHIVTESTVQALARAIGGNDDDTTNMLSPTRFRPNIVVSGENLQPFAELDWVGQSIQCTSTSIGSTTGTSTLRMKVIAKTVRCQGVSVDPLNLNLPDMDIPALLVQHFPEHGPYLGVYAVVESGGCLCLGDELFLNS